MAARVVQGGPSMATNITVDGTGDHLRRGTNYGMTVHGKQSCRVQVTIMKLLLILLLSWIQVFNVTPY